MAAYYFDCEFSESFKTPISWLPSKGFNKPYHNIDLISIGICSSDGREYYAVCKDFDLDACWNKWQQRTGHGDRNNLDPKHYWLRENVLLPIFYDLAFYNFHDVHFKDEWHLSGVPVTLEVFKEHKPFHDIKWFRKLLNRYGKTKKEIANEILDFVYDFDFTTGNYTTTALANNMKKRSPLHFYGYYSDYDWVLLCSLFGTMQKLPELFPMHCRDLKQIVDERVAEIDETHTFGIYTVEDLQREAQYPKIEGEHHSLNDARWAMQLHKFLREFQPVE